MESLLKYNKTSIIFDKYEFKLEEKYKKLAEKNLRETDGVREKTLTQLRVLIKADPRIIDCRTDSNFLLRFLRVKKFQVEDAHRMIYRYLKNRQLEPQWFRNLDVIDPLLEEILDLGVLTVLPRRDVHGRQIWIYEFGHLVPGKHTSVNFIRLQEILYQLNMEDERAQICGIVGVVNFAGMTMRHATIFPLWDFKKYVSCVTKSVPQRVTEIYVLNLPRFMQIFYEVGNFLVAPKLRKRFRACKSLTEFETYVDIDLFPERYGGKEKQEEIVRDIKEKILPIRDKIKALDEMKVDLKFNKNFGKTDCNSSPNGKNIDDLRHKSDFRMLQVD